MRNSQNTVQVTRGVVSARLIWVPRSRSLGQLISGRRSQVKIRSSKEQVLEIISRRFNNSKFNPRFSPLPSRCPKIATYFLRFEFLCGLMTSNYLMNSRGLAMRVIS